MHVLEKLRYFCGIEVRAYTVLVNEQGFVDRREVDWNRLAELCDKSDTSLKKLSGAELKEFIRLYRRVSTDLALARTKSTNIPLISYLNDLAGRAYGTLYRSPRKPFWGTLFGAIATGAQTVRRHKWFVLVSALLTFAPAFIVFFLMDSVPDLRDRIVTPDLEPTFKQWQTGQYPDHDASQSGMMAAFYASHNPEVAIITGAIGAGTFGTMSVYFLVKNGLMLGALAHDMRPVGHLGFLLTSICPHGVTELSGCVVSGSAGLLLAWALINPGRRRRADALKAVGKDAIVLLATSVILMFMAAPVEAFFSFQPQVPPWAKIAFAAASATAWACFWILFGREQPVEALAQDRNIV